MWAVPDTLCTLPGYSQTNRTLRKHDSLWKFIFICWLLSCQQCSKSQPGQRHANFPVSPSPTKALGALPWWGSHPGLILFLSFTSQWRSSCSSSFFLVYFPLPLCSFLPSYSSCRSSYPYSSIKKNNTHMAAPMAPSAF